MSKPKAGRLSAGNAILYSLDKQWRVLAAETMLGSIYHVESRDTKPPHNWSICAITHNRKFAIEWFAIYVVGGVVKQEPALLDNL